MPGSGSPRRPDGECRCGHRPRSAGSSAGRDWPASSWLTCAPARPGWWTATRSWSPATGFPIRNWPGWPGSSIDPGTRGPAVDTALQSCVPDVFAAGNLVHAAETADVAALGGRHAARHLAAALRDPRAAGAPRVPVTVAAPLSWISPNAVRMPAVPPPRGRFVLRAEIFRRRARLEVRQDGRLLATARASLVPTRPVRLRGRLAAPGGPVRRPGARAARLMPAESGRSPARLAVIIPGKDGFLAKTGRRGWGTGLWC